MREREEEEKEEEEEEEEEEVERREERQEGKKATNYKCPSTEKVSNFKEIHHSLIFSQSDSCLF
jgi:hypothetical protein